MQIVIDIPDRIYYGAKTGITVNGSDASQILIEAVANGIPLPEGMIDADKVKEGINKLLKEPGYQHEGEDWRTGLIMAEDLIYDALTIIKADNEERQDEKT